MKNGKIILIYTALILGQCFVWSNLDFTRYVIVAFLPVLVFRLPFYWGRIRCMAVAFVIGLLADWLSFGILGMTAFALLPVAFFRPAIHSLTARNGSEEDKKNRVPAIILVNAVFLALYIWLDGAGVRTFLFNAACFLISLFVNSVIGVYICRMLSREEKSRWN